MNAKTSIIIAIATSFGLVTQGCAGSSAKRQAKSPRPGLSNVSAERPQPISRPADGPRSQPESQRAVPPDTSGPAPVPTTGNDAATVTQMAQQVTNKEAAPTNALDCRTICARLKTCSDAFAEAAGKGLPPRALDMMKREMRKQFADTAKCEKQCNHSKNKEEDKRVADKCMPKTTCKAFAECLITESKKQQQKRVRPSR